MATGLEKLMQLQSIKRSKQEGDIAGHSLSRLEDMKRAREAATADNLTPEQIMDSMQTELTKLGRVEDALKIQSTRTTIKQANIEIKAAQTKHRTVATLQASQMLKLGNPAQGNKMLRELDPDFIEAEWLGEGKFLYKTKSNPKGQVVLEKDIITAATDAPTQYRAWQKALAEKEKISKTPLPKRAGDREIQELRLVLGGGTYDDIVPELSDLGTEALTHFAMDMLDRAKELQAEAQRRGEILGGSDAREMAAQSLKNRMTYKKYFTFLPESAQLVTQTYSPVEKKATTKEEKKEAPPVKHYTEIDEKNMKTLAAENKQLDTREKVESAYDKWKAK